MKILIVSQYFPPEVGAPQNRLYELGVRLLERGNDVTVLTAMPNYPTGRLFDGYRWRLWMSCNMDGIRVVRVALFPSKSARMLPRLLSYISFSLSSLFVGSWFVGRQDVCLVESPPLFLAPAGVAISRIARAASVIMVSDIWPDILLRMGYAADGWGVKTMLWLERWAYRHFDAVALTNPGALRQVCERFPRVNATVISNGVDTSFFRPDAGSAEVRAELGAGEDTFLVGYCGLHGLAQGLPAVVEAATLLQARSEIRFVLMGDGPVKDELVKTAQSRGLRNIEFFGKRPREVMPAVVASCDILVVPLGARLPGTMPSKLYEALAAGTPVVVAKGCEGEALVGQFDCGMTFEPNDGQELANVIATLSKSKDKLADMGRRAVEVAERFDRAIIVEHTEQILEAVSAGKPLPSTCSYLRCSGPDTSPGWRQKTGEPYSTPR